MVTCVDSCMPSSVDSETVLLLYWTNKHSRIYHLYGMLFIVDRKIILNYIDFRKAEQFSPNQSLRGYCTSNQKLACFVLYLKIFKTFLKKNMRIL